MLTQGHPYSYITNICIYYNLPTDGPSFFLCHITHYEDELLWRTSMQTYTYNLFYMQNLFKLYYDFWGKRALNDE